MRNTPYVVGDIAKLPLFGATGDLRAWVTLDAGLLTWALASGPWFLATSIGTAVRHVGKGTHRQTLSIGRAILGLPPYGEPKVRHENGSPLDNRRSNLVVSHQWVLEQLRGDPVLTQQVLRLAKGAPPLRPPNGDPTAADAYRQSEVSGDRDLELLSVA